MFDFLKVIRYKNLLFIIFIQLVMKQVVIHPLLQTFGIENSLNNNLLYLLIAATVFIAAGGYVLNDYFDVKIDAINRPDKQIVGTKIQRQTAMLMHQILSGIGIVSGLALAFLTRSFTLGFSFIVIPGLLWFYSASYKRQFIVGNLVIAFITSITILIVGISQVAALQNEFGQHLFETQIPHQIYGWVGGFSVFAFLCTWIREIIKDIIDEKGDREMECHTMPIVWGINRTKWFIYGLITVTVAGLFIVNAYFIHFEGSLTLRYLIFGLLLPFAVLTYLLAKAKSGDDYYQTSKMLKVIMFIGVSYGFIFYYLQAKTFGITLFNLFIVK